MNWLILVIAVVFIVVTLLMVASIIDRMFPRKPGKRITVRRSIDEHGIIRFKNACDCAGVHDARASLTVRFAHPHIEYCGKRVTYAYTRDFSMYDTDIIMYYDDLSEVVAVMTSNTLRLYGGVNKVFTINDDIICQSR